jgi:hypothetical protein
MQFYTYLGSMLNGYIADLNLPVPSDRIMPCLCLRNEPFLVYPKNVNIYIFCKFRKRNHLREKMPGLDVKLDEEEDPQEGEFILFNGPVSPTPLL